MRLKNNQQVTLSKRADHGRHDTVKFAAPDQVLADDGLTKAIGAVDGADLRAMARLQQACIEQHRLMRHQRIALDLATFPHDAASQLIEQARQVVKRWKHEHLCSKDYIERWESILNLPPKEMSETIVSDMDGWGSALRQNSPWVGLHA